MSRRDVVWALGASAAPMGQQTYEVQLTQALLRRADPSRIRFRPVVVQGLRGRDAHARRVSLRVASTAPYAVAAALGAAVWGTSDTVHRFDTRLPPFPGREVLTVHDVAPLRFDDEGSHSRSWRTGVARATAVIAPSRFAAGEISSTAGRQDVVVIPNGVADAFLEGPSAMSPARLAALGVRGDFVLCAGGATTRKNLVGMADAWGLVHERLPHLTLVLAGPPDARRDVLFHHLPRVVQVGRVADGAFPELMASAQLFISPSVYEGFGLPALEAMACGVPVVAVDRAATPEVCGDAAVLVGSSGPELARGLQELAERPDLRRELSGRGQQRAQRFTWDRSADAHLDVYEQSFRREGERGQGLT